MTKHTIIRRAKIEDADELSQLIEDVARRFCFMPDQDVPAWFLSSITPRVLVSAIENPDFSYFVAQEKQELVGVLAVRETNHIQYLFVSPKHQKQGIAQQLWENAKQLLSAGNIVVRSSLFAVPVYERFGFVKSGPVSEKEGLSYQPMELRAGLTSP